MAAAARGPITEKYASGVIQVRPELDQHHVGAADDRTSVSHRFRLPGQLPGPLVGLGVTGPRQRVRW
jgi:hypothetical protein